MFKKKEPVYKRQEVVEEDFPEEESEDNFNEELIDELETPQPQYEKKVLNNVRVERLQQVQPKQVVKKEVVKEQVVESVWSVEEVPTQTQPIIFNSKEKRAYTIYEVLVELLKRTED
jgi:hypothetical protein